MDIIHAPIRSFLQQQNIIALANASPLADKEYLKAGVVPFLKGEPMRFYVMKPRGNIPALGAPLFQVCKGTRQHKLDIGWRDMKESAPVDDPLDVETLAETALREGAEELGLKPQNIVQLYDLGDFTFSSATTGKEKHMWLFATEVKDAKDFLPASEMARTTERCEWVSAKEFQTAGREDHRYILTEIERRLLSMVKE